MKRLLPLLLCLFLFGGLRAAAHDFKVEKGQFWLDGKPVTLICGEMHYPRIPQEYWRDRMLRAKAMGLNSISTYVFWNIHERQPGVFDFSGEADLAKFIRTAQEVGLYVVLRPGPYVCAEWDFGGFPYWLQKNKDMVWRSDDPAFLAACRRYIDRLGKEVAPLMVTRGGPVIMVQVENEYGSYSNDKVYLGKLRDMLVEAGFDAPLITCDGAGQMPNGYLPGCLPTINGSVGEEVKRTIDRYHPGGPYFVAEFYPAWFDVWGQPHSKRAYRSPVDQMDWLLGHGISVNMFVFHGGTNFAYTNGANTVGYGYEPQPTSYDYDAPLGEYGNATEKFYAFREMIRKHLPEGTVLPDLPEPNPVATFAAVELTDSAPLRAAFSRRLEADRPLTMEEADQDFGYIHYETTLREGGKGLLVLKKLRDYAVVWVNGKRVGTLDRRHRQNKMEVDIPAGAKLSILVENTGRVNYGPDLLDNLKGITEGVTLAGKEIVGWTTTPLPLYTLKKMPRLAKEARNTMTEEGATFRHGFFRLDKKGDVFLDMRGWGKGAVWVNGHSIGKYWRIGPQQTLYVPGPWVKKGKNEIIVFDMEGTGHRSVAGLSEPILDSVGLDPNASKSGERQQPSGLPILEDGDRLLTAQMKQGEGVQRFDFAAPATMRHLCLEIDSSYDGKHSALAEIDLIGADGKPVAKDAWSVVYVNTEQPHENDAEFLFDEKTRKVWHSQWRKQPLTPFPHRVIIDLGEIQTIKGISLQQRPAGQPGQVKGFTVYGRPQFFLFRQ